MIKKIIFLFVILAGIVISFVYLIRQKPAATLGGLKIVAANWPAYILTKPVADLKDEVTVLASGEVDPHNFSASPQSLRELSQAQVLIKIGAGLEEAYLPDLLKAVNNAKLEIIDLSQDLNLLESKRYLFDIKDRESCLGKGGNWQECGPNQCQLLGGEICPQVCGPAVCLLKEADPHIWLDPILASKQVTLIGAKLANRTGDLQYQARAKVYSDRLIEIAQRIHDEVKDYQKRGFVAQHPAFTYFADRFKIPQLAVVEQLPAQEPTLRDLERISQLVREQGIKVIFIEPGPPEPVIENFSKELNLKILELDPMEAGKYSPDYYEKITLKNLMNFKAALDLLNQ